MYVWVKPFSCVRGDTDKSYQIITAQTAAVLTLMQCNTFDMKNGAYQPDAKALQLLHIAIQENTNTTGDFTF